MQPTMTFFIHMQLHYKQARKGFRPPSAMKGIGYFQNLRNLLIIFLEFFWIFWNFLVIFQEDFFEGIYLEEFFGRNFLGGFFGRNYLVEINKELMFLSRFCLNAQGRKYKNLDPQKCEASSSHLKNTKYFVCITFKNHYGSSKVLAQHRFFTTL